jgi:hypothetical protein
VFNFLEALDGDHGLKENEVISRFAQDIFNIATAIEPE